jgi:hypothetical protein
VRDRSAFDRRLSVRRAFVSVDRVHPFVARLLLVSLGASGGIEIAGCAEAMPAPPPVNRAPRPFDALAESAPDIVADAYVKSDLSSDRYELTAKQCAAACGPEAIGCEAVVDVTGDRNRPARMTGRVECSFRSTASGTGGGGLGGDWDPFHLNSCPFGCGRRPLSTGVLRARGDDSLRSHVAEIATMEALSVDAFAQLALDLDRHAPRFVARAERARKDEQRHARRARAVLREIGGTAAALPRVARLTSVARGLDDVAEDNAVEGCVHETFGAVALSVQARRAEHPLLRRFFQSIARDEIEHAALSWDVHDALWSRLCSHSRARIQKAQRRALAQIEAMPALPEPLRMSAGAPSDAERRTLARTMRASLADAGLV